jgi:methylmalonyl-CoA/ethylmalonyl-CoA epimerase
VTALGPFGQIALGVSDADRVLVFYRDVLKLPFVYRYENSIFFDCGGVRLLVEASKQFRRSGGIRYFFRTPDIYATYDELRARGVIFNDPPHVFARLPDHQLWIAAFEDPDGNGLAIIEEKRA